MSDNQGHVVYYDNSKYVTLELSLPSYNRYNMGGNAEPMYFNLSTWTNQWLESYMVSMKDLSVVAEGSSQSQMVSSEQDAINNRLMPTTEVSMSEDRLVICSTQLIVSRLVQVIAPNL